MRITPKLVRELYLAFLEREPENQEIIERKIEKSNGDLGTLLKDFLDSFEFLVKKSSRFYTLIRNQNFDELDPQVQKQLFTVTLKQWVEWGNSDPFWSVLSDEKFKQDKFKQFESEFWISGQRDVDNISNIVDKYQISVESVLDFGCGVGRLTIPLSQKYQSVFGMDISPGNLTIMKHKAELVGKSEVISAIQMSKFQSFDQIPPCDLVLSLITLQHNTPPIQSALLRELLGKVKEGGMIYVQIPTYSLDQAPFDIEQYLSSPPRDMDMYGLPISEVCEIFEACNVQLIKVFQDNWAGNNWISHTFLGRRLTSCDD
jgi:2-polyprenyl-3-methyl-5-hydroxy-6-metoxy-1,4-benzoquinol methylase